jgi:peptide/nickel transport system substrate-binding protein
MRRGALRRFVVPLAVALLVSACTQGSTAPAAPAKDAPATTAPAAKPTAPAAQAPAAATAPAAKPAAASTTAPAAQATTAPASKPAGAAAGMITLAIEAQATTLDPQNWAGGSIDTFYFPSVYDSLVGRDPKTKELIPRLAKSWERVDDTTWRFKLQDGVKFTNGEEFNAKAVEYAVNRIADPQSTAQGKRYFPTLAGAKVVDNLTIDLLTKQPDPILPARAFFLMIGAPGWMEQNKDKLETDPTPGTGPYKMAEWQRDQFMRLTANDAYWGTPKPTVADIKLVFRREATVRANMIKTGEANIAFQISAEDAARLSKTVKQQTVEVAFFKMNTAGSILEDIRLRQAIVHAIDVNAIAETIYAGLATPANALVGPSAVGYNPDLPAPTYDPEQAKQLVTEAGGTGKELMFVYRIGWPTKVDELTEAIASYLTKAGFKVKLVPTEVAQWNEFNRTNGPGAGKTDLFMSSHGNDLMDSVATFESYYRCQGQLSLACFPDLEAKISPAAAKSGAERDQALRALWKDAADVYATMPLFIFEYVHGVSDNVEWEPRLDGYVYYNTMRLTN